FIFSKAGNELGQLLAKGQPAEGPILLATFVNLDNLEESSSLGRIIPQQIGTELANHGFEVLDIRLRTDTVQVKASQGEFALSRKLQAIAQEQETYAVLVGTYSVLYEQVYVNAKILKGSNKMTLAATDYFLPYEPEILHPEGFAGQNTDNRLNIQPNVRTSLK
ncbi:MAG: FlgO family outer membrane protein, partial [Desulfohalobiaceae bacterium]